MKITNDDYNRLEKLVIEAKNYYHWGEYKDYVISYTRYIWEIFHATCDYLQRRRIEDYLFIRALYDYLNDDNLETALKKILPQYEG